MEDKNNNTEKTISALTVAFLFFSVLPLSLVIYLKYKKNSQFYFKNIYLRIITSIICILPIILLKYFKYSPTLKHNAVFISIIWSFSYGIACLIAPFVNRKKDSISVDDLKKKTTNTKPRNIDLTSAYIGRSKLDNKGIYINPKIRCMHTLVAGATGMGKTSLLDTFLEFDFKNGFPVIIIDPKANIETISRFKAKALRNGVKEENFKVFSLIDPLGSLQFNPLMNGTPTQIKDRILGALVWSEPYYKAQADLFLINLLEIFYSLGITPTINYILQTIDSKNVKLDLKEHIRKSELTDEFKDVLIDKLNNLIKIDTKNLSGLYSQLSALNALEFNNILSPNKNEKNQINFIDAINEGQVLFFALNVGAYPETAPVVGRFILMNLKSLMSQIHAKAVTTRKTFISLQVDEFGSFVFDGWADFQKLARDCQFMITMYIQGLADLDKISPEFKSQVQSNTVTKFVLRTDDPYEVDFWSSVAGTMETVERSYQTDDSFPFRSRTGAGNERESSKMKVSHDTFKELSVGQAVLIQKNPHNIDLIDLYYEPDETNPMSEIEEYNFNKLTSKKLLNFRN